MVRPNSQTAQSEDSPEQGVIEGGDISESFGFCQSESFAVGLVPNLRKGRFHSIFPLLVYRGWFTDFLLKLMLQIKLKLRG